METKQFILP